MLCAHTFVIDDNSKMSEFASKPFSAYRFSQIITMIYTDFEYLIVIFRCYKYLIFLLLIENM